MPADIDRNQDGAEDDYADDRLVGVFHDEGLLLADDVADDGQDGTPSGGFFSFGVVDNG